MCTHLTFCLYSLRIMYFSNSLVFFSLRLRNCVDKAGRGSSGGCGTDDRDRSVVFKFTGSEMFLFGSVWISLTPPWRTNVHIHWTPAIPWPGPTVQLYFWLVTQCFLYMLARQPELELYATFIFFTKFAEYVSKKLACFILRLRYFQFCTLRNLACFILVFHTSYLGKSHWLDYHNNTSFIVVICQR